MTLTPQQHDLLARILTYVLETEERSYEECDCTDQHIYALARIAWCEFEMDITPNN
jgi:hypothetical protein